MFQRNVRLLGLYLELLPRNGILADFDVAVVLFGQIPLCLFELDPEGGLLIHFLVVGAAHEAVVLLRPQISAPLLELAGGEGRASLLVGLVDIVVADAEGLASGSGTVFFSCVLDEGGVFVPPLLLGAVDQSGVPGYLGETLGDVGEVGVDLGTFRPADACVFEGGGVLLVGGGQYLVVAVDADVAVDLGVVEGVAVVHDLLLGHLGLLVVVGGFAAFVLREQFADACLAAPLCFLPSEILVLFFVAKTNIIHVKHMFIIFV